MDSIKEIQKEFNPDLQELRKRWRKAKYLLPRDEIQEAFQNIWSNWAMKLYGKYKPVKSYDWERAAKTYKEIGPIPKPEWKKAMKKIKEKTFSEWLKEPLEQAKAERDRLLEEKKQRREYLAQLEANDRAKADQPSPSVTPPPDTPSDDSQLILLILGVLLAVFAGLVFIGYKMRWKKG